MAASDPARLTPREGRRFAVTVGVALLALAAASRWRGHTVAPLVLAALGAALVTAGVVVPARLGPLHRAWMAVGDVVSKVTTPVVLSVIYFFVVTPVGVLLRLAGRSPLRHRAKDGSYWARLPSGGRSDLEKQF